MDIQSINNTARTAIPLLVGSAVAVYAVRLLISGQRFVPGLMLAVVTGVALLSALNRRYWLLIPLGMTLAMDAIPVGAGRSIELREIAIAFSFGAMVIRAAMLKTPPRILRPENVMLLLFFGWVFSIWALNPTGLMLLGAETIGGRFYVKLVLALCAFVVMSNITIGEREIKWVVWIIVGATVVSTVLNFVQVQMGAVFDPEHYYTWHQGMATPSLWVAIWLFARKKIERVLRFPSWELTLYLLILVVSFFSGKRAGVAAVLLVPVIQVLLDRKGYVRLAVWGGVTAIGLGVLVAGHGTLYTLPRVVQRSVANLPGDWEREVIGATRGVFRANLRELALWEIRENPLTGMGGYAIDLETAYDLVMRSRLPGQEATAFTRSWHTTWLGIAADFGIPAALFWAAFCVQALIVAGWLYRQRGLSDAHRLFVGMFLIHFVIVILRSWTSGHSALTPLSVAWLYGLIISIKRNLKETEAGAGDAAEMPAKKTNLGSSLVAGVWLGGRRKSARTSEFGRPKRSHG